MALTSGQKNDFISDTRQVATDLLDVLDRAAALGRRYNNGGYSTAITDDDFSEETAGANAGLAKGDVIGAIVSLDAFLTLLSQGHGTNLEKVRS